MTPSDFGPIYTETDLSRLPVEPWNTASNLIFLFIVIYFWLKVRRNPAAFPVVVLTLPILLIGFIGGTIFHATRSHNIWLYLDFIPILLLSILASLHLWRLVSGNLGYAVLLVILPNVLLRIILEQLALARHLGISIGYAGLALTILLPAFINCFLNHWVNLRLLAGACFAFVVAILFRYFDKDQLLPMGTHFLWHIFGGVSAFWMIEYIYQESALKIETSSINSMIRSG